MRIVASFLTVVLSLTLAVQMAPGDDGTALAAASGTVVRCKTTAQIRQATRLIRAGLKARCTPPSVSSSSKTSSSRSSSAPSSVSSVSSSAISSSASSATQTDTFPDTDVRSQFLLLGETGPVLGGFKVFLYEEPFNVTAIQVNVNITGNAIDSLLVYDENRVYLGRATSTASTSTQRTYRLELRNGSLTIPQRAERSFYVRPVLMRRDAGGTSGLVARIQNATFEGNGYWSNRSYTQTTTDNFVDFQTARGIITSVRNAGLPQEFLVSGTDRNIGSYAFAARKNDGIAEVKLTQLQFTVEQAGGITLSNARIGVDGDSTRYSCSVATDTVTCSTLADIGVIDASKTFHLYADISIPVGLQNGSLRLTLNNGGSIVTAGAVSWTDGTTAFTWLPAGGGPIAAGTLYKF